MKDFSPKLLRSYIIVISPPSNNCSLCVLTAHNVMARHQKPYKKSLTANRNDFNNNGMNDSIFGMNDSVLSRNDK